MVILKIVLCLSFSVSLCIYMINLFFFNILISSFWLSQKFLTVQIFMVFIIFLILKSSWFNIGNLCEREFFKNILPLGNSEFGRFLAARLLMFKPSFNLEAVKFGKVVIIESFKQNFKALFWSTLAKRLSKIPRSQRTAKLCSRSLF